MAAGRGKQVAAHRRPGRWEGWRPVWSSGGRPGRCVQSEYSPSRVLARRVLSRGTQSLETSVRRPSPGQLGDRRMGLGHAPASPSDRSRSETMGTVRTPTQKQHKVEEQCKTCNL